MVVMLLRGFACVDVWQRIVFFLNLIVMKLMG